VATDSLASLLEGLTLTRLDGDRFEGRAIERTRPRMFGGDLLGQALVAAGMTAEGRRCHGLHMTFLLPGDPTVPIEYRVRRLRDGHRFAQRQVSAWQREREILVATASFTGEPPDSHVHQHESMPEVPGPDGLLSELEHRHAEAERLRPEDRPWLLATRAVEVRQVRPVPIVDPSPVPPLAHTWLRAVSRIPDDPLLHAAIFAYACDMTLLDITCYPLGLAWIDPNVEQASLDHAMWFHRPFRMDEWLLYAQVSPVAAEGRALARGSLFTREGTLVATVAQEGVSRVRGEGGGRRA
jgi:acyl-CoA thioesterase II